MLLAENIKFNTEPNLPTITPGSSCVINLTIGDDNFGFSGWKPFRVKALAGFRYTDGEIIWVYSDESLLSNTDGKGDVIISYEITKKLYSVMLGVGQVRGTEWVRHGAWGDYMAADIPYIPAPATPPEGGYEAHLWLGNISVPQATGWRVQYISSGNQKWSDLTAVANKITIPTGSGVIEVAINGGSGSSSWVISDPGIGLSWGGNYEITTTDTDIFITWKASKPTLVMPPTPRPPVSVLIPPKAITKSAIRRGLTLSPALIIAGIIAAIILTKKGGKQNA